MRNRSCGLYHWSAPGLAAAAAPRTQHLPRSAQICAGFIFISPRHLPHMHEHLVSTQNHQAFEHLLWSTLCWILGRSCDFKFGGTIWSRTFFFFHIFLFKYSWFTELCYFQGSSTVIQLNMKESESEVAQSCPTLQPHGLPGYQPTRLLHPWNFPCKSTGVGCHFLLQGIFPTQGSNPGLPHYRQTLYHLSHQGSPVIYKWGSKWV